MISCSYDTGSLQSIDKFYRQNNSTIQKCQLSMYDLCLQDVEEMMCASNSPKASNDKMSWSIYAHKIPRIYKMI